MKYYGTELNKRRYEILMSAGGVDALEWESERSKGGARPRAWLRTKANSIEGGTSEVMLGIVAKRILDLPGACCHHTVMAGLVPAIHVLLCSDSKERRGCPAQGRA
jgi:hypothetical protein